MTTERTSWTGWDRRSSADAHAADGVASGGEVACYELLALAGRGFRPPDRLTVRALEDASADEEVAPAGWGGFRRTWSAVYRQVAETAPASVVPYAIYLLGVNPPDDATDDELAVFNDFYTSVHLVEVAERRHALRAVRFELEEVVRAPVKGAPRFLATYEVDETSAAQRRHTGPPYSKGPEVWQRHTTPWRLWYRRLGD